MKDLIIRPIKIEDAPFMNEMRLLPGVQQDIYALTSERLESAETYIRNLTDNDHMFVAEISDQGQPRVIGAVSLHVDRRARAKHRANLGIMVHKDFQGKGVGHALMNKALELGDRWLKLVRIELEVFCDNTQAVKLYESMGFKIEGTGKYAAIKDGKYCDVYFMARYNPPA